MPARKSPTESWWSETDPSDAPGGQVVPARATGGRVGAVGDARANEGSAEVPSRSDEDVAEERTEVIPRGGLRPASSLERFDTPAPGRYSGRRSRPAARRVRRTLRHVDPLSVLKLSLFYYGCFLILWLVFVAVLYGVLSAAGLFERVEELGRALVLWDEVQITLWFVERWAFFIGLVLAVLASIVNVFLAFLYNLAADVVGGAEFTFVERDQ
jgi:hypothetical protein